MSSLNRFLNLTLAVLLFASGEALTGQSESIRIKFIDYYFENGSPLLWEIKNDTLCISLLPDYQRETLNRQTDHWYFRIVAEKGTRIRLKIKKMVPDIYNGRLASDWWNYKTGIPCYFSYDNKSWDAFKTFTLPGKELIGEFTMESDEIWLSRLPVYNTTNLDLLLSRIAGQTGIKIFDLGKTFENRPLEMIQLGKPDAEFIVIMRARAHPWEPGGNWVIEGLVDEFIREYGKNITRNLCIYILPMANKDGVVRGMTRFNTAGMDLNRNWDRVPDSLLCPENYCLNKFITALIEKGKKPDLVIDLHNDDKGDVHLAKQNRNNAEFRDDMMKFEKMMRIHTSFSEAFRYSWNDDGQTTVMSMENGLLYRFGMESFVYELNANWITGLGKIPSSDDWRETGKGLLHVLNDFLEKN